MIIHASSDNASGIMDIKNEAFGTNDTLDDVLKSINGSPYLIFVIDNKVVGFLNYLILVDRIEIVDLAVKEGYKRRKVATNLILELFKIYLGGDYINITLEVNVNNECALNLYKKLGFEIISTRKGYYNGIDGYVLLYKR